MISPNNFINVKIQLWILFAFIIVSFSSCNVTLPIKDGQEAYDLKKYSIASEMLQEDYEKAKDSKTKHDIAVKIAKSYLAYSMFVEAENWYKRAVDLGINPQSIFEYAMVLKRNEKYDLALNMLKTFYEMDRSKRLIVEGHSKAIQRVLDQQGNESHTKVENLESLNTSYGDFAPKLDGNTMYLASNKPKNEGINDEWSGLGYANIYMAAKTGKTFTVPEPWLSEFSTQFHEAILAFMPDKKEVYFTRCGFDDDNMDVCKIFRSFYELEEWSEPEQIVLFDDSTNVGHPFISADGKKIVFQ